MRLTSQFAVLHQKLAMPELTTTQFATNWKAKFQIVPNRK